MQISFVQWRSRIERSTRRQKCVFESQPPETLVVKTGSDISNAKRLVTSVSVMDPPR